MFTTAGLLPEAAAASVVPQHELDEQLGSLRNAARLAADARALLAASLQYTCSVGIAMGPVLAKLVGGQRKPDNQTTLLPSAAWHLVQVRPLGDCDLWG